MRKQLSVRLVLYGLLLCMPALTVPAAEYYRWVDEEGNMQFTQTPPPEGKKAEKEKIHTSPSSAVSGQEWLEKKQKGFKDIDKKRLQAKEREAEKKELAESKARDCAKVKRRLQVLVETPRVQTIDADGKHTMMAAEARQSEINKMRGLISEYC